MMLDRYFANLAQQRDLSKESLDKVRDVLASILKRAIRHGLLVTNPLDGLEMPRARKRSSRSKPFITPQQFEQLVTKIPEPYRTMVYVAVFTGLRVSELVGLRWNDVHDASLTVDERYCRGDWGEPKSEASNATIAVNRLRSSLSCTEAWGHRATLDLSRTATKSDLKWSDEQKRQHAQLTKERRPDRREFYNQFPRTHESSCLWPRGAARLKPCPSTVPKVSYRL